MTTFPAIESLSRSTESDELINGGSIAINRILNNLRDTAGMGTQWRLWLINAYSLCDSNYKPDMSRKDLEAAMSQDVELLTQYISAYVSHYVPDARSATIVIYFPTYQALPKSMVMDIKATTKGGQRRIAMDKHYDAIRSRYPEGPREPSSTDGGLTLIHVLKVGSGALPHVELARYVRGVEIGRALRYKPTVDPTAIITHCPLDMHIRNSLRNIRLLERHTGSILPMTDLSKRIHKSQNVPFTPHTHQAFGDRVHLKEVLTPAERRLVLKDAEDGSWRRMTEGDILKALTRLTKRPAVDFDKLNL